MTAPPASADATAGYRSIFRPGLFAGQVALVTGGGSGIGRCTAHELAALGARIAIAGRSRDKLAAVQGEIEARGGVCSTHAVDIRDEPGVQAMVADVLAAHGRIDALVNNAGGQYPAPLATISAKGWDAVVRNNLTGGFLVARECVNQWMLKARSDGHVPGGADPPSAPPGCANPLSAPPGGAIVNVIADMWQGMPMMGHSGAARAGMLNLTETAALEWAPVRVNAVAPGWIASSGLDRYDARMTAHFRSLPAMVPLRRLGTESECSAAIVYLLSPAAAFVSGACIRVDGAAPNARRHAEAVGTGSGTPPFDGFHLASRPKVLDGT